MIFDASWDLNSWYILVRCNCSFFIIFESSCRIIFASLSWSFFHAMNICIRWNDDLKNVKIRFFRYTNFLSCFPKRFISIDRRYDESSTIVRKLEGTFSLFIRSIVPVRGILRSFFLFFFLQEIVSGRFSLSRNKLILFRRIRDNLVPRYRLRSDKLPRL